MCLAAHWQLRSWLRAQPTAKVHHVAYVGFAGRLSEMTGTDPVNPATRAFKQGLRDLGYLEGQNVPIEWRSGEGNLERLPQIMRELISLDVDVIASGNQPVTQAAHAATQTIPIVMTTDGTPIELGYVQSLARPGGNITGLTFQVGWDIHAKRLQLLKELLPTMERPAWLFGPETPSQLTKYVEGVGQQFGLTLVLSEHAAKDYSGAFALLARERPDVLLLAPGSSSYNNRGLIVEFAAQSRLPAMYWSREFVDASGLVSYGADLSDLHRRAARYVDKVLKGAKPADLPMEQPNKFQLVVNLKTAKALGLTVPRLLLVRADEVIE